MTGVQTCALPIWGRLISAESLDAASDAHADLTLFGNDVEVKTGAVGGGGATISTNRSYVRETPGEKRRLLVAANYRLSRGAHGFEIRPFLIRTGWIGPLDYLPGSGNGQVTSLSEAGYAKLHTLYHAPIGELPATLVPGIGAAAIGGHHGEVTISAARALALPPRATARLADATIEVIRGGRKAKWPLIDAPLPSVQRRTGGA